jgi:CheY-like chemotaxis protein
VGRSRFGVNPVHGGFACGSIRATIKSRNFLREFLFRGGVSVLRILIVEDDPRLAATVKYLVEDNPRYRVVATAEDDLVLLDLHLARGTTGFSVAVRLNELGVPCLFVSGKAPSFPMPDLALGCLMKPFTAEDVHRSLAMAEDLLRGRETLRPKLPDNLTLYEAPEAAPRPEVGYIPSKPSLRTRLEHWIAGQQH